MAPRKPKGSKGKGNRTRVAPRKAGKAGARTAKAKVRPRPQPARDNTVDSIEVGALAPDVSLLDHNGQPWNLSDFRGRHLVLYFYPADMTSGCTTEACEFNAALPEYDMHTTMVIGVSPDDAASHQKFRAKHNLDFPLAFDPSGKVFETFGVWKEKNFYGKKSMGVERSTFLIDSDGVVRGVWRRVKAQGHAQAVLEAVRALPPPSGG